MRACRQCGLSIGDTATFCPVCGTLADPEEAPPAVADEPIPPAPKPSATAEQGAVAITAAELEAEAHACEKTDPARAATLYRQAIVERLDSGDDLLTDRSLRRDVQRLFDRLSGVLKREGQIEDALEEIDAAAYLGLVHDEECGTKARREALVKRREALRRAITEVSSGPG